MSRPNQHRRYAPKPAQQQEVNEKPIEAPAADEPVEDTSTTSPADVPVKAPVTAPEDDENRTAPVSTADDEEVAVSAPVRPEPPEISVPSKPAPPVNTTGYGFIIAVLNDYAKHMGPRTARTDADLKRYQKTLLKQIDRTMMLKKAADFKACMLAWLDFIHEHRKDCFSDRLYLRWIANQRRTRDLDFKVRLLNTMIVFSDPKDRALAHTRCNTSGLVKTAPSKVVAERVITFFSSFAGKSAQ